MTILGYLAAFSGIFLGLASVPQVIKIFTTKSAKDISVTSYLIVEVGALIWVLYGFELHNFAIVVPNILGFLTNSCILIGCWLYGKPQK